MFLALGISSQTPEWTNSKSKTSPLKYKLTEGGTEQTNIQLQQVLKFHILQITVYTISLSTIIALCQTNEALALSCVVFFVVIVWFGLLLFVFV